MDDNKTDANTAQGNEEQFAKAIEEIFAADGEEQPTEQAAQDAAAIDEDMALDLDECDDDGEEEAPAPTNDTDAGLGPDAYPTADDEDDDSDLA